jgi:hypothetical protein
MPPLLRCLPRLLSIVEEAAKSIPPPSVVAQHLPAPAETRIELPTGRIPDDREVVFLAVCVWGSTRPGCDDRPILLDRDRISGIRADADLERVWNAAEARSQADGEPAWIANPYLLRMCSTLLAETLVRNNPRSRPSI